MRRKVLALCALLLCPALARAEGISIAALREQAEQMGRWTKTYEVRGRTVEVDIPVLVPKVEAAPSGPCALAE